MLKDAGRDESKIGGDNNTPSEKKFPWNDEQWYAVELFQYANRLAQAVGSQVTMKYDKAEECFQRDILEIFIVLLFQAEEMCGGKVPSLKEWLAGKRILGGELGSMITEAGTIPNHNGPRIGYSGDVENVPLDEGMMQYIESLEEFAGRWGVEIPARPNIEDVHRRLITDDILKAAKDDALKLIAACEDGVALAGMVKDSKALKLPKYKLKAIGERITELSSSTVAPACVICGGAEDVERDVCMSCIELIQHGPKKQQKDVLAAIAKAPVDLLIELKDEGLSGDWRRQAVAKRIKEANA